jgi:hypothetical protein
VEEAAFMIVKPVKERLRVVRLETIAEYLQLGIPLTQQTTICRFRVWRTIRGRSRNSKIVFRPKKAVGPMC